MTQDMAQRIVCRFKPAELTPSQKRGILLKIFISRLEYGNAIAKVLKNYCAMQILGIKSLKIAVGGG